MNKKTIPEYRAWKAMKSRCYSPSNKNIGNYSKNNIQVCKEWLNNFEQFYTDMGQKPGKEYSLDRKNNLKNYSKENCRWTTQKVQCSNRGTFNLIYSYNGTTMVLKDWARKLNIDYSTLHKRITYKKLSFEESLFSNLESIDELSKQYNISKHLVYDRMHRGWNLYKSLTTPKKQKKMI